jgi:hypothetical protein
VHLEIQTNLQVWDSGVTVTTVFATERFWVQKWREKATPVSPMRLDATTTSTFGDSGEKAPPRNLNKGGGKCGCRYLHERAISVNG